MASNVNYLLYVNILILFILIFFFAIILLFKVYNIYLENLDELYIICSIGNIIQYN